jgi:hypothetical protein
MPRAVLVAAAAVTLAAATASPARADCASPRVVFAPADGAAIPVGAVLHVFVPGGDRVPGVSVVADGQRIAADVDVVGRGAAGDVTALSVRPAAGVYERLTVEVASAYPSSATYRRDRGWRARRDQAVKLAGVTRERHRWSCSHTDAVFLDLESEAVAFEVEWARSADAWDTGTQAIQVLPRHRDDFWRAAEGKAAGATTTIGLGHLSCLGETIPEAALGGPLYVRVTGLFVDGSRTAQWAAPVLLTEAEPEPETETDPEPEPESDPDPDPDPESDPDHDRAILVLGFVVLGIAVVLLVVWRRRRAANVAPPPR